MTGELPLALEDYESVIKPPTDIKVDSFSITFPAGYFPPSSASQGLVLTKVNIIYEFDTKTVNTVSNENRTVINIETLLSSRLSLR